MQSRALPASAARVAPRRASAVAAIDAAALGSVHVPEAISQIADGTLALAPTAFGALGAVGLVGAVLVATDPQRRRSEQMTSTGGNEKAAVANYFNGVGFERWNKIYGTTDDVNSVQLDIRKGHAQTVDKVLSWLPQDLSGVTVCDAGCGTGSLALPLALHGADVAGFDISQAMADEAARRYDAAVAAGAREAAVRPRFAASDLQAVSGRFHTVACIDVLIHYPQERVNEMIAHLAGLAEERVILSFAPSTPYYEVLKRIGELFPKGAKATRAYLHTEQAVEAAFNAAGWRVVRRDLTATRFYFSRLFEAVRM
ncbi:hypothetical protein WJX81_001835 [Elliptochloris bilobata]|uniref:Magnesium-protoporphyrin IX methyltransferase C-terminal domain-containing protein n=1 Tax=Elliptochloris bilobata TaxID=381761 RepID=A0AAW1RMW6_9CHLO